jgi:hypothetical protein
MIINPGDINADADAKGDTMYKLGCDKFPNVYYQLQVEGNFKFTLGISQLFIVENLQMMFTGQAQFLIQGTMNVSNCRWSLTDGSSFTHINMSGSNRKFQ